MYPKRSFLLFILTGATACSLQPGDINSKGGQPNTINSGAGTTGGGNNGQDGHSPSDGDTPSLGLSESPQLRFKHEKLLRADLQAALNIANDTICKELGELDCISEVHHIELGGVDAYERAIYTPLSKTSATTPIIIERVVLSACQERLRLDQGGGSDAILTSNPTRTGKALVNRAFLREPTKSEIAGFKQIYKKLGATNGAMAACYATFTSTEFLFY